MLQSSLTFQGEHDAWRQRVNKEVGASSKFFQTGEMNSTRGFGSTGFSNVSTGSTTIHPYHRSNLDRKVLKRGNFYMLDSTYLVASNPNTMRDQGPCRNAEYYFAPSSDLDDLSGYRNTMQSNSSWHTPDQMRKQYIKTKGNKDIQEIIDYKNKGVYSYGGRSNIGSGFQHKNAYDALAGYNPDFSQTFNKWTRSMDGSSQIIEREYNQKVNDYTKNISQSIFSPGLVDPNAR